MQVGCCGQKTSFGSNEIFREKFPISHPQTKKSLAVLLYTPVPMSRDHPLFEYHTRYDPGVLFFSYKDAKLTPRPTQEGRFVDFRFSRVTSIQKGRNSSSYPFYSRVSNPFRGFEKSPSNPSHSSSSSTSFSTFFESFIDTLEWFLRVSKIQGRLVIQCRTEGWKTHWN